MSHDHHDRVVFITGAGSGIGRATAIRLATEGASIIVADIDPTGAAETVALVEQAGGVALAVVCVVRSRPSIAPARDDAVEHFGTVSSLVNNAGVVTMESLDELTEDSWDRVLDINLKGPWLVAQEFTETLAAATRPAVVNLGTVEGEVVVSSRGTCQVHYNASKGGVKMLTKALAIEMGRRGIRVNAVAPGPIATDFVSLEGITSDEAWEYLSTRLVIPRVGRPDDVAAAISFLLSEDAAWITGVHLPVDGGWLTR